MNVYIANFGRGNSSWPDCLKGSIIAVMDGTVHPYWERGNRAGYIAEAQQRYKSWEGRPVTSPVASRCLNLNDIVRDTDGEIWIHREKEQLWWTLSIGGPVEASIIEDPHLVGGFEEVYIFHKRCQPWSERSKNGASLEWKAIHAKAREFLFTEGTFQRLSDDNALYAQALIDGGDLEEWHPRPLWSTKADRAGKSAVTIFSELQLKAARMLLELTAERMAQTAHDTAGQSGRISITQSKDKKFSFVEQRELEAYAVELYKIQECLCALTGLELILDAVDGDPELRYSLDRIDSFGHYERGDLQIVCKFANRWKGTSDNVEFKRLVEQLRTKFTLEKRWRASTICTKSQSRGIRISPLISFHRSSTLGRLSLGITSRMGKSQGSSAFGNCIPEH
jgi:hypothetical protein